MWYFLAYWFIVLSIPAVVLGVWGWFVYNYPLTPRGILVATAAACTALAGYVLIVLALPTPFPSVA